MTTRRTFLAAVALVAGSAGLSASRTAHAQFAADPSAASDGKDVMWVPTPDAVVTRMLDMAGVGPDDLVVDLGSGDGRIAIAAAKQRGARARGIEYSHEMVAISRNSAELQGVAGRVSFRQADLFEVDFSDATVLTLYLLSTINIKLRPKILGLRPGTRVVSHVFGMGDWEPDQSDRIGASEIRLWIVPARVAGAWRLTDGAESYGLTLQQHYQRVTGSARHARGAVPVEASLRGADVRLAFSDAAGVRRTFAGRVDGDRMQGDGWRAVRGAAQG